MCISVAKLCTVHKENQLLLFLFAAKFITKDGMKLSERTFRRYLHKNGVRSSLTASKPFLTTKHNTAQLNWFVMLQECLIQQWCKVEFCR